MYLQDCDFRKCIPLVVHGDGADSHRRRSFMIVSVSSLLVDGGIFDSKLLCYVVDYSRCTAHTIATLDSWIAWGIIELQLGFYLDVDPWGRPHPPHAQGRCGPICGGWRGILVCHKGDEKYIQKVYKTSHTAVSKYVCTLCRAENQPGPMVYTCHGFGSTPQSHHARYFGIH